MPKRPGYDLEFVKAEYARHGRPVLVAKAIGCHEDTARKLLKDLGVYRRCRTGMRRGPGHPEWRSGRKMDRGGYVLQLCGDDHPGIRTIQGKRLGGNIFEHRIVMEIKLGRYLEPNEVVDHIDGCRFHNAPENLRLFRSNGEHLKNTIAGQVPQWSEKGKAKIALARWHPDDAARRFPKQINTYQKRQVSGDVRLQQILLGRELLGTRSIWFLGMHNHFEKFGIAWPFGRKTERDLAMKHLQMLSAHPALKSYLQG